MVPHSKPSSYKVLIQYMLKHLLYLSTCPLLLVYVVHLGQAITFFLVIYISRHVKTPHSQTFSALTSVVAVLPSAGSISTIWCMYHIAVLTLRTQRTLNMPAVGSCGRSAVEVCALAHGNHTPVYITVPPFDLVRSESAS